MTNPEFSSRYQLLQQVTDGAVRTFHAVASTGAVVLVHFLDARSEEGSRTLLLVQGLPLEERARILELTEVDGSTVLITKFLLEFDSLRSWLEARSRIQVEVASPPPAPEAVSSSGRSEFTDLFKAFSAPDVGPVAASEPAPPTPGSPPSTSIQADDGPGEFTRLFRAMQPEGTGASGVAHPPPASPREDVPPPPEQKSEASEVPPRPDPPSLSFGDEERKQNSGELDLSMRLQGRPDPPPPPSASDPPAPKHEMEEEPGEFTRLFGRPQSPGRSPADGYLGRLSAGVPSQGAPPPAPAYPMYGAGGPADTSGYSVPSGGASEFTRLIASQAPPPPPQAPAPPAPSEQAKRATSWSPLLFIAGLLVVAAVALLVFFALSSEPEPRSAPGAPVPVREAAPGAF